MAARSTTLRARRVALGVQSSQLGLGAHLRRRAFCGSVAEKIPPHIRRPPYAQGGVKGALMGLLITAETDLGFGRVRAKTSAEIEAMRYAGRCAREVLDEVGALVSAGVTTAELDAVAMQASVRRNCYPSPLGYRGFPASCCTSVNEVVCHGIPSPRRRLQSGDIVNVDVTIFTADGFHGDCSEA
eukprot:TRINITY_DN60216_c0_g1_i1.p1 TRINITY_DN60216_c0_g1~~TRINITY_DN60216_c0_g1_i1.p1  ORF type:complete len:185 (+),score=31.33 TRINITY_DN60216_c0_g1_i1:113-667(+)